MLVPVTLYVVVTEGVTTIELLVPPVLHEIPLIALVLKVTDCPAHSAAMPLGAEELSDIKQSLVINTRPSPILKAAAFT